MESKLESLDDILNGLAGVGTAADAEKSVNDFAANSNAGAVPENQKPAAPPQEMIGPYTASYFQSLIQQIDICDNLFQKAKNLGYYSDGQRYTSFLLDLYNTDKTPSTAPPGKDYSSLSPAQKKVVLAGLVQIVQDENNAAACARAREVQRFNEDCAAYNSVIDTLFWCGFGGGGVLLVHEVINNFEFFYYGGHLPFVTALVVGSVLFYNSFNK